MSRIIVVSKKIAPTELARLLGDPFENMVKFVVDLDRRAIRARIQGLVFALVGEGEPIE